MSTVENEELIDSSFYGIAKQNIFEGYVNQFFSLWYCE